MKVKGFTLFELILASSLAIILVSLAIPGFTQLHHRSLVDKHVSALFSLIQLGRKESISRNKHVILCGSEDGKKCEPNWSKGFMLFIDNNRDNQFSEPGDLLLSHHIINSEAVSIEWRSFRINQPIRFIPAGITWHNNGTFKISHKRYQEIYKTVSIAKSGRAKIHNGKL